jgi:hypothetical protein
MGKKADFKKTKIYRLCCNQLSVPFQYIGHTTDFQKRKAVHKYDCHNKNDLRKYNQRLYQVIREYGGFKNWSMILVERFPCENNKEACIRERYWAEQLNSNLNTRKPYRSDEELKNYYIENKERIDKYQKEYRDKHKHLKQDEQEQFHENISIEKQEHVPLISQVQPSLEEME